MTEIPVVPAPEIHDDGSHDDRITAAAGAHVNVNRIEFSERTLSIAALVLASVSIAFSCFAFYQLTRTEREYRLLQIQQQMTNAWLARAGMVEPMDVYNGPEGNFFHKPKGKDNGRP